MLMHKFKDDSRGKLSMKDLFGVRKPTRSGAPSKVSLVYFLPKLLMTSLHVDWKDHCATCVPPLGVEHVHVLHTEVPFRLVAVAPPLSVSDSSSGRILNDNAKKATAERDEGPQNLIRHCPSSSHTGCPACAKVS